MTAVISIPARMTSTRFPGKVLADLGPDSVLGFIIDRLSPVAQCVVVTSGDPSDEPIVDVARFKGARVILGTHGDMIAQHWRVAIKTNVDHFLMAGADDPLLDPALFRVVLSRLEMGDVDYVRTAGWPLGMNVWGWTQRAIRVAMRDAKEADERQHVVPFWERGDFRKSVIHRSTSEYDRIRVTVDEGPDIQLCRLIVSVLPEGFGSEDVIALIDRHPELLRINADGLRGTAARDAIYRIAEKVEA